jgi:hypothetical protein
MPSSPQNKRLVSRHDWLFVAGLALVLAGCADLWGLDTLNVGDASASPPGPDSALGDSMTLHDGQEMDRRSPPPRVDSSVTPDADASADTGGGATCIMDPTVSCSNVSNIGFSCTGSAQLSSFFPNLMCGTPGSNGSSTTYCCLGNWCSETLSDACNSCILNNCAAPDCECFNLGPTVDDAGDTECDLYEQCVANCQGSTSSCQNQCASGFAAEAVSVGNVDISCIDMNCGGACGL